jgi:hypothetical protein
MDRIDWLGSLNACPSALAWVEDNPKASSDDLVRAAKGEWRAWIWCKCSPHAAIKAALIQTFSPAAREDWSRFLSRRIGTDRYWQHVAVTLEVMPQDACLHEIQAAVERAVASLSSNPI